MRQVLGDSVWFCIQADSQKDVCAAYRYGHMLQSNGTDPDIADYSEAGMRLCLAVEREVMAPFFADLYDFVRLEGVSTMAGVELGPQRGYHLGLIPALLLAEKWRTFKQSALGEPQVVPDKQLYYTFTAAVEPSDRDRTLLVEFFEQWEHPMAACFREKAKQAAASLDQIHCLHQIATNSDSFLYVWHYQLLRQLVVGGDNRRGLFRQIYGG